MSPAAVSIVVPAQVAVRLEGAGEDLVAQARGIGTASGYSSTCRRTNWAIAGTVYATIP